MLQGAGIFTIIYLQNWAIFGDIPAPWSIWVMEYKAIITTICSWGCVGVVGVKTKVSYLPHLQSGAP